MKSIELYGLLTGITSTLFFVYLIAKSFLLGRALTICFWQLNEGILEFILFSIGLISLVYFTFKRIKND